MDNNLQDVRTDTGTLCALSAMAFVAACVGHEALGHGGACLLSGGTIELLTSAYFKCSPSPPLVDAAGPSVSLALASGSAIALIAKSKPSLWRSFIALLLAFNGFWGAGYFLLSALTVTGDWAFVFKRLAPEQRWIWRFGMGVAGISLYLLTLRIAARYLPRGRPLLLAYFAAGFAACASTLFFAGEVGSAMFETAKESFIAALGLPYLALERGEHWREAAWLVPRSPWVQMLGLAVIVIFWLTLGRGLRGP